jgi:GTP-binding protein
VNIEASFVRSAAGATDLPGDGLAEIAFVGRSNVGKSSLINALVRQRVARTSAAPGKTRLANIYRVTRGGNSPLYLVDLPGYGYARGGAGAAREFDQLTRAFFGRVGQVGQVSQVGRHAPLARLGPPAPPDLRAVLLVDARHPGLQSDIEAWRWLQLTVERAHVVATKIDKLAGGERIRALRELESVCETSVLPVSAVTGEGLDELWTLISPLPSNRPPRPPSNPPPKPTARPRRRRRPKS